MNDETYKPNQDNTEPNRSQITVDEFIHQFDDLAPGTLYVLPHYPNDSEAQMLAKLKTEILVMQLPTLQVVISKGSSKSETSLTRGEVMTLQPIKKAHTHPVQPVSQKGLRKLAEKAEIKFEDINQEMFGFMGTILPSPLDFTVGSVGARTSEIWNEYGRTIYTTYSYDQEELLGLALQMATKLFSGKEFITILADSTLNVQEKINKLNTLLGSLGVSFEFQPWEATKSLEQGYPKNDGTQAETPTQDDLQKLTEELGAEAVAFLSSQAELLKEIPVENSYYVDLKFVAMIGEQIVEIGIGKDGATEIHFSTVDDYTSSKANKYETTFDQAHFGSSLKFMRFMDELLSKIKKDARLMIMGASGKRGKLFQQRIDHHGLTNAFVASFVE